MKKLYNIKRRLLVFKQEGHSRASALKLVVRPPVHPLTLLAAIAGTATLCAPQLGVSRAVPAGLARAKVGLPLEGCCGRCAKVVDVAKLSAAAQCTLVRIRFSPQLHGGRHPPALLVHRAQNMLGRSITYHYSRHM